jgi:hypothetical protein
MMFEAVNGKEALVDLIELFILMNEFGGVLKMDDKATRLKVEYRLHKKGKEVDDFLDKVAEVELIDSEAWINLNSAGSNRSIKDAETRQKRREFAAIARAAKKK